MTNAEEAMRLALELAARGRGSVEPNPMVGAVVWNDRAEVVGRGWHQKFGEAHAEVHALREAGEAARGGTLFVTLEPCCHVGKTPPCTGVVLQSGVRSVVVAMADPFPKVAGGGIELLRREGLDVQVGLCEAEARDLNAPYLKLLSTGLPWVHLKWAMTLDGKIATRTGDSRWISGEQSRRFAHELRGRMDAILVGAGTVYADNPLLTTRPPGPRVPTRVIVSASGNLPSDCHLRTTAREVPVLIFTTIGNRDRLAGWANDGAELVCLPEADAKVSLRELLAELGRRRMTNVLVEGGGVLHGAFLDDRLVDEVHTFIAPQLFGGTAPSPIQGQGIAKVADAAQLHGATIRQIGNDCYINGRLSRT